MTLLQFIMGALYGTPWWVWIVFGYLLVVGVLATRPRVIELPKLFIIPVVFLLMRYNIFLSGNVYVILSYVLALVISVFISEKIANYEKIEVIKGTCQVKLPGNYSTLVLLMLIFTLKYVFGYVHATSHIVPFEFVLFENAVSGILAGIFWGKALNYTKRYYALTN